MPIANAYEDLKVHFEQKGCKIRSETAPTALTVKQGSLWGISPQNAKKIVTCTLSPNETGTKISCQSKLSRDWINLTVIGTAMSVVLVGVCLWMSLDLAAFLDTGRFSTWSWIASVGSYVDYDMGQSFVGLTRMLAAFLTVIILSEVAIALYAHSRIDLFTKSVLSGS
jgi:hypothetical protein